MTSLAQFDKHLAGMPSDMKTSLRMDASTAADPKSRMDANTLPYLSQQLEQVQAKSYETPHAALPFMEGAVIPIESDIDPGAESWSYYIYDGRGQAKWVTSYASDEMPVVDVDAVKVLKEPAGFMLGYTLNKQEMRAAAFGKLDLARRRVNQANLGHREFGELVAAFGDTGRGIDGFLNHVNTPELAPTVDGAGETRWDLKDPFFIATDFANMLVAVHNNTAGIRKPNALLLPSDLFEFLKVRPFLGAAGTVVTAAPSMSVLQYLMGITDMVIGSLLLLQPQFSKGNLQVGTAIAYIANDADIVSYKRIMDTKFYEPVWKGLSSVTSGESRTGGCQIIEPFTMVRMPGVSA